MKFNVASLFAGVGGICLGFKRANENYNLVVANEIDDKAIQTYKYNFEHSLISGDIERILNPNIFIEEKQFLIDRINDLKCKNLSNYDILDEKKYYSFFKEEKNNYLKKVYANGQRNKYTPSEKILKTINFYSSDSAILKMESLIINSLIDEFNDLYINSKVNEFREKKNNLLKNKIDILTGGFPCQAFSIAGQRKGFEDFRGNLFYSVINYVKELNSKFGEKPRILFLENVKNLLSHDNGNTFNVIKNEIEKLGYKIKFKILNTYEYTSLPQNRERIFIICFLNEKDYNDFNFDNIDKFKIKSKEVLKEEIENVLELNKKEEYLNLFYTKDKYPIYYNDKIDLNRDINEFFEFYQLRRGMYVRKNMSGVCPTLTANMGTGGHNVPLIKTKYGVRKLSPEECFNLQGFDIKHNRYRLPKIGNSHLYKQAGNAVSVNIIEKIAKELFNVLEKNTELSKKKIKVLYPIYPKYIEKIFSGEKKYEFRRRIFANKDVDTVVMYATSPIKKVVGEFKIKRIILDTPENLEKLRDSSLNNKNFKNYFKNKDLGYAIEIGEITRYPDPKEITDIFPSIKMIPQSFMYIK